MGHKRFRDCGSASKGLQTSLPRFTLLGSSEAPGPGGEQGLEFFRGPTPFLLFLPVHRRHFPFFRTAPEGWKNTIRHNLCFRDSFEKVPVSMQCEAHTRPRSCLWKLTEEGHRRFAEETRTLAFTRLESIQQCMSQPGVKPCHGWVQGWGT